MAYEIIDKNLKIAACSLTDLTLNQIESFLKCWEDDATIRELTLFISRDGYVVLNRDNINYSLYLGLTVKYLSADEKERTFIRDKASDRIKETIDVVDKFIKFNKVNKEISIAMKNYICELEREVVDEIIKRYEQNGAYIAFRYGVICGKRDERARRKRHDIVEISTVVCKRDERTRRKRGAKK